MSKPYRPKRFSKRWNEGAPKEVLDVIDSRGPGDRYTILFTFPYAFTSNRITGETKAEPGEFSDTYIQFFGTDANPGRNPGGVSMWGEMPAYQAVNYRYANGPRRIKWLDLPEQVRKYITREIENDRAEAENSNKA